MLYYAICEIREVGATERVIARCIDRNDAEFIKFAIDERNKKTYKNYATVIRRVEE